MRARLAATFIAAVVGTVAVGSAAEEPQRNVNLRTKAGAVAYLQSIGVDATDVVFQNGAKNYAGPNCPGTGWTCAPADRPVVQSAEAGATNTYECSGTVSDGGNTCVVVQSGVAGANTARCVLSSNAPTSSQSCNITQDNQTGANLATISMSADPSAGMTSLNTQRAEVRQTNVAGGNTVDATQTVRATSHAVTSTPIQQIQDATQSVGTDQRTSGSGANAATLTQQLTLRAISNGGSTLTQRQNASSSQPDMDFISFQSSDGGGTNTHSIQQKLNYQMVGNSAPLNSTQIQGNPEGGQHGGLTQISAGRSTTSVVQEERQHAVGNAATHQEQYGPHICCDQVAGLPQAGIGSASAASSPMTSSAPAESSSSSSPLLAGSNQRTNGTNNYTVDQATYQNAEGDVFQDDLAIGRFHTTGTGTITQFVSQEDGDNSNSCSGSDCEISQSCINATCDTVAPDTTITSAPPALTTSTDASFSFTANEPGSTFECSLDGTAFAGCASPKAYTGLSDGAHTFAVRAIDASGNTDATPAEHTWTIDTGRPTSSFDPKQDGKLFVPGDPLGNPTLKGTASDATSGVATVTVFFTPDIGQPSSAQATLTCGPGNLSCTWSVALPSTPGRYTARTSATDAAGNVEPQDESIRFTVVP